ncbi:MAG: hexokinase [Bacteroidetes bacterium]|nr:hexokinase [Bacteroidota bacterium]
MKESKISAKEFIQINEIGPDSVDMQACCNQFMEEMKKGLSGEPSPLKMLPTYISIQNDLPVDEPVIVLDAGGTNFRICTVTFNKDLKPVISNFRKYKMPGLEREVTAKEFFTLMAEYVLPIINTSSKIGFCFSYPADISSERDGRLIFFSKEIKAPEVWGMKIGENLLSMLGQETAGHIKTLTLLNDTVATLLAAKAATAGKKYSGYIGFILGTGTNTSYLESNKNITKISGLDQNGYQVINVESGGFGLEGSHLDQQFYATTENPEMYHFEKLISGAYLGPYAGKVIETAIDSSLFSSDFCDKYRTLGPIDTIIMDSFLHEPQNTAGQLAWCCADDDDSAALYQLLDAVIERAGKLTAVNLSAAVLKADIGTHPTYPACINADGTTFYKTHNLKVYTEYYLHQFLGKKHGRYYEIISVDNAPVLGAAIAGLMN